MPLASTPLSRVLGLTLLSRERLGAGRVIDVRRDVAPIRFVRCPAADAVLELPSP